MLSQIREELNELEEFMKNTPSQRALIDIMGRLVTLVSELATAIQEERDEDEGLA